MAFSANILSQNKIQAIPVDFQLIRFRTPRIISTSPSPPQNLRSHRGISISSATKLATDVEIQEKSLDSSTEWEAFAQNVSGEWDGYGAEFTCDGKPIEIPENVVPEAYKEWEVKVFDWQTQCPTLAETEEPVLMYKLIKLLPTVGCEADAATRYSIDERNIGGISNKVFAFSYHPSGCYVAGWPMQDHGTDKSFELEYCLVDPRNKESRVRVIQVVQVEETTMKLQNIKVFSEQWYGPFRNGEQLGGCAIRESGFASTDALKGSEIEGEWKISNFIADFQNPQMKIFQELVDEKKWNIIRDQGGLVLLPRQLWCSLKETEDGETVGEVGWLLDRGYALTSRCVFMKDGQLKEVAIAHETSSTCSV